MPRRAVLSYGVTALVAPVGLLAYPVDQAALLPQAGDLLVFEEASHTGAVVSSGALPTGGPPVLAWAMEATDRVIRNCSRTSQILLVRLDASTLSDAERPFAADGVVGFSAICTHAGCAVSGWKPTVCHFLCPCHGSIYDPAARGRVLAGPAPRPLPALPLRIDGNALTVAAGFTAQIGGYTGRTD